MTALGEKAATGVATQRSGIGKYVGVGLLALALGVGAVVAAVQITGSAPSSSTPAEIADVRAAQYVSYLQAQWLAQVQNTRGNDMVERFAGANAARVAEIQSQRAQDMVDHLTAQNAARLTGIHEQRAQDMVDHKWGGTALPDE